MPSLQMEKTLAELASPAFVIGKDSCGVLYANRACREALPKLPEVAERLCRDGVLPDMLVSEISWGDERAWLVLAPESFGHPGEGCLPGLFTNLPSLAEGACVTPPVVPTPVLPEATQLCPMSTVIHSVEILKCRMDDGYTIISFSDVLPTMLGCQRSEIATVFHNRLAEMIHPEDLSAIRAAVCDLPENHVVKLEYRLKHKSGRFSQILDHSRVVREDGERVAYCILLDVTFLKELEITQRTNEERYRLALEGVCDIIYDYDVRERRITHCSVLKPDLLDSVEVDMSQGLFRAGVLDEHCREALFNCRAAVGSGGAVAACMLSGKRPDGSLFWFRHNITLVAYEDGRPARALGTIQDVTEQKRRELSLRRRSETDALTGLLNRGAFEAEVSSILAARPGRRHVFGIIDVDDFKSVNDTYGHLIGDQLLSGLSAEFRALLGERDVLGRLGGDEFAFLLSDAESVERGGAFASGVCRAARLHNVPRMKGAVTCSIGMAVAPEAGRTFRTLYQRADMALYRAKQQGKDTFVIHEPKRVGDTIPDVAEERNSAPYLDRVTGCRNFGQFRCEAEAALGARAGKYAVWFIDIKHFKHVNEVYGYDTGDEILQSWAQGITAELGEGEVFARISGDKFALLSRYGQRWELEERFQALANRMESFVTHTGRRIRTELIAGIYLIENNNDISEIEEMINRATIAQKIVKPLHGSNFIFYSPDMRQRALYEMEIESSMNRALEQREFVVYLHPQVSLRGDGVLRAEALVRWRRLGPDGVRLVPPRDFIPLFERNGFIIQLDLYVFEEVCRYLSTMFSAMHERICLAVNVSGVTMLQPDFAERYAALRDAYGLPCGCIELEFSESIAAENYDEFRIVLEALKERGFLCSIDDFGAGSSTLGLLKNLPVDTLKLDRLFFVDDAEPEKAWAVVRNTMHMAHDLSMYTVAEGIEDAGQVERLRDMGCDCVQGFVFSRPTPMDSFSWSEARKIVQEERRRTVQAAKKSPSESEGHED